MAANQNYSDYFAIDAKYYPCFGDAAIKDGADWKTTFPHDTFINLLSMTEKMLSRNPPARSIWMSGVYGTGKSMCAFALKKILEEPESELRDYWDRYEDIKKRPDLLQKFLTHKKEKIVTAYRNVSGDINSTRDLLVAVQESVKKALLESGASYLGENSLKDAVIAWIKKPEQKNFFNGLLQKDEWNQKFSEENADQVLDALLSGREVKQLLTNIFEMADKEGIRAFSLDTEILSAWLKDVIKTNGLKALVFIWDEFGDYFRGNRKLSGFQALAELCVETPFYFIRVV